VTVMFSDLVGSTALSARMDPEDLREVISAYQKCVAETVQRFGGFVAKYMGDGVLVYFGYPQAHEDDAERAVRAGLGLIAAVSVLKTPVSLQTRVGIATGLVVVGDLLGSGEARCDPGTTKVNARGRSGSDGKRCPLPPVGANLFATD
jgi:class 3 adenylate cyclase